jgi:lipopolysaccharide/colanic/teichoic acid biosynthesis glycosyltransferase
MISYHLCKRAFDFFFALLGLGVFSPLIIVIVLLIKLDSPGPALYRGVRVGLKGEKFRIFKFRTMAENAERIGGPSTALNDPRLTRVGRFLRKYKLDELPQLINIVRGEMSFVGPRPQVEQYTKLYNQQEKIILSVKPGLTDYASIRFVNLDKILGNGQVDEKYYREIEPEKNRLRIRYVRDRSTWVDFKIIIRTLISLFRIRALWNTQN